MGKKMLEFSVIRVDDLVVISGPDNGFYSTNQVELHVEQVPLLIKWLQEAMAEEPRRPGEK